MKDGVILRISKPVQMGIDDAPLHPLRPPRNYELLPFEHGLRLIPTLIAHAYFSRPLLNRTKESRYLL